MATASCTSSNCDQSEMFVIYVQNTFQTNAFFLFNSPPRQSVSQSRSQYLYYTRTRDMLTRHDIIITIHGTQHILNYYYLSADLAACIQPSILRGRVADGEYTANGNLIETLILRQMKQFYRVDQSLENYDIFHHLLLLLLLLQLHTCPSVVVLCCCMSVGD